jgi:hypothetical protein
MIEETQTVALVEETTPAPAPEPIPNDLPLWEEGREFDEAAMGGGISEPLFSLGTATDAARLMARVAHFARQKEFFTEPYTTEIQRLKALIATLEEEKAKVEFQWDGRAAWYRSSLEFWARQQNAADPKIKTIALPYGSLKVRAQQPKWEYGDEADLQYLLRHHGFDGLVRTTYAVDKNNLKKVAKIEGGKVFLKDDETGEMIEVEGVEVIEQPPKFELEVTA